MQRGRRERVIAAVQDVGGVSRTRRLRDSGVSRHDLEAALAEGVIVRVRPGWVVLPGADPQLVAAARRGVVLTCITQARRLGIWVHDRRSDVHVGATPGSRGGKPRGVRVHWSKPVVARHPDALEDPIENVLAILSTCEPFERAVAAWESALNKGLVERNAVSRLPLPPSARRALDDAWPFADAGLETYFRVRLRWLRVPMYFQAWIAGHRVDALIGERLVVQIDGATHVGAQRSADIRHDAELMLMGFHVIRVGYHEIMTEWPVVQDRIMRAVAQGLHLGPRR